VKQQRIRYLALKKCFEKSVCCPNCGSPWIIISGIFHRQFTEMFTDQGSSGINLEESFFKSIERIICVVCRTEFLVGDARGFDEPNLMMDLRSGECLLNPGACRLLDVLPEAKLETQDFLARIHSEDQQQYHDVCDKVLQSKQPEFVSIRWRRKDGKFIWLACVLHPIQNPFGAVVQLALALTERSSPEVEQILRKEKWDWFLDRQSSFFLLSTRWAKKLDLSRTPTLQQFLSKIHPDDQEEFAAFLLSSLEQEWQSRVRFEDAEGQQFSVQASGRVVRKDDETVYNYGYCLPDQPALPHDNRWEELSCPSCVM